MKKLFIALTFVLSACGNNGPAAVKQSPDSVNQSPAPVTQSSSDVTQSPAAGKESLAGDSTDREALKRTTAAIRDAFARGDIDAILALHHPAVIKYFGGNNVMTGRESMRKQLTSWLGANKVEFVENTIESTVFNGETAIETCIFAIRNIPKNGGAPSTGRGRSMVVYIKYAGSPTGWASLREVAQDAPPK